MLLMAGDKLDSTSSGQVTVGKLLGTGERDAAYQGHTADGRTVAIRWYLPSFQRADLRRSISELAEREAPSTHFLWPDDLVTREADFGYTMDLRPPDYVNLSKVLTRKVNVTFRELLQAATHMVDAFKALQAHGLFYYDISDANLLIQPSTGKILICDNDNVGSAHYSPPSIGTHYYMAPEIVRGEKQPSPRTDSFSMAVLLFLILFNDHPLQGAAESRTHILDAKVMKELYGTDPVFIFDPSNDSNRPVPGVHINAPIFWDLYPQLLKDVFTQAFTDGLHKPEQRPTFTEWQTALSTAEDLIYHCPNCGKSNFLDVESNVMCWNCRKSTQKGIDLPGGGLLGRVLRFYWIVDVSASMAGSKISQLNFALREWVPAMRAVADENPHAAVEIRVMTFGEHVTWITPKPVPIDNFTWTDLVTSSRDVSHMGMALKVLATEVSVTHMPDRALSPMIVVVSDGVPTDNFDNGLDEFMAEPWARRAVRQAVAIGDNADIDVLRQFIGHPEIEPLRSSNAADVCNYVRWVSEQALGHSLPAGQRTLSSPDMPPPPPDTIISDDIW